MKYFWLTWRHKYFVFLAGLKTKAPMWRLIIHDWSKFLPSELPHYNRQFFPRPRGVGSQVTIDTFDGVHGKATIIETRASDLSCYKVRMQDDKQEFWALEGEISDDIQAYEFITAWTKHQNRHPHHWEYWIPRTGHNRCDPPYPDNQPIAMPWWAVREMIADWMGASRAYEGRWPKDGWPWYWKNRDKIRVTTITQTRINTVLQEVGLARVVEVTAK